MKHSFVILGVLLAACLLALAIYVYAPGDLYTSPAATPVASSTLPIAPAATPAAASTTVAFKSVTFGTNASGEAARKNFIVRDAAGLSSLATLIFGTASSSMPAIDFNTNDAIAVFAGQEPTGGYAIQVTKVVDSATARTVFVTIGKPGANCTVTESTTNPYAVISVPMSALPLAHIDTVETRSCK